jgi:hypothetical protein
VLAIDLLYEEGANGKFMPVIRDVEMLRVTSQRSQYGVYIRGFEGSEISGVRVLDCTFDNVAKGNVIEHAAPVTFRNVKMNGVSVS